MIQAASIARDVAAYHHAKLSAIRVAGEIKQGRRMARLSTSYCCGSERVDQARADPGHGGGARAASVENPGRLDRNGVERPGLGLSVCGVRLPRPPVRFQRGRPWGSRSSVRRMGGPRRAGSGIVKLLKGAPQFASRPVRPLSATFRNRPRRREGTEPLEPGRPVGKGWVSAGCHL
jgi:hypothetical protein